jgi:DNA-binding CsgD family transcriptional regulator
MSYQHGTDRHGRPPADRGSRRAGAGCAYSGTAASSVGRRRSTRAAGTRLAATAIARQASAMPASGSELRVARLAAEGRSNREIACELYVTLKAVEGHLAHAYAKLGIEGRGQLPRALAGKN